MSSKEKPDDQSQEMVAGIVVADIESYSSLTRDLSEVGTLSKLNQFLTQSSQLLKTHDAQVTKFIGDGIFAVFGNPLNFLAFALALQQSLMEQPIYAGEHPIQVRIGVHAGQIVLRDTEYGRDAFGYAITLAARMVPYCEPGGVIISEQLYRLLTPDMARTFVNRREIVLKHGNTVFVWESGSGKNIAVEEHK
jgi:adenylate cyclase